MWPNFVLKILIEKFLLKRNFQWNFNDNFSFYCFLSTSLTIRRFSNSPGEYNAGGNCSSGILFIRPGCAAAAAA